MRMAISCRRFRGKAARRATSPRPESKLRQRKHPSAPNYRNFCQIGADSIKCHFPASSSSYRIPDMLAVNFLHGFDVVDVGNLFIGTNPHDTWKPQGIAARVAIALLYSVKRDFDDDVRFNEAKAAVILGGIDRK